MNIVFLDVDGVLVHSKYKNKNTSNIDIQKVKMLKRICKKGNAKVVISSSWRGTKTYTPRDYYVLQRILGKYKIEVIDDLPYIDVEFENINDVSSLVCDTTLEELPECKFKFNTGRGAEVKKWLLEHNVDNFVILDDENWDWDVYGYTDNWVQPSWFEGGLQKEHVTKAIKILRRG